MWELQNWDLFKTHSFDILKTNCHLKWPEKLELLWTGTILARFTLKISTATKPIYLLLAWVINQNRSETMNSDSLKLCTAKSSVSMWFSNSPRRECLLSQMLIVLLERDLSYSVDFLVITHVVSRAPSDHSLLVGTSLPHLNHTGKHWVIFLGFRLFHQNFLFPIWFFRVNYP